jgi:hypothetical protein
VAGVVDRAGVKVERPERRGTTTLTPARVAAG